MLNTIKEEFLNELNNQSPLSGSFYNREDVSRIINIFAERVQASIDAMPKQEVTAVNDEVILRIAEIAEQYAHLYAEDCADEYNYENCIEFDTNDYGGELRVTAEVNIDSSEFKGVGSFADDQFINEITELLNPKPQA
jgi:tetrahydromethanopterin S-methyltransferase subunit B